MLTFSLRQGYVNAPPDHTIGKLRLGCHDRPAAVRSTGGHWLPRTER